MEHYTTLSQLLPALGEAPQAEQGLEEVVADDDVLDVVRISVLHEPDYDKIKDDQFKLMDFI